MFLRLAAFLLSITIPFSVSAQVNKIDPLLNSFAREKYLEPADTGVAKAISYGKSGRLVADCFVEVYNPADAKKIAGRLESFGATVRSIIGEVMTASIPLDVVEEVAEWEEIRYIEAGKPLLSKLSNSISGVRVTEVHNGEGLDKRYDGSGVIVGIVDDTRLDWGHNDFKDPDGNTRILFVWDKGNSGKGVAEISNSSGLECTKAKMDAGTCGATAGGDGGSHATHVAGIAAGDDGTFKGMAPNADIISVFNVEADADSGGDLSTTIVDDVRYIFAKASTLRKPAVVNLSLGTSIGAHDDTSSMEKALNNLVGSHPGRAIVNAAGNENFNPNDTGAATYNGIHATVNISTGTDRAFDFAVRNGTTVISLGREIILDIWLNATSSCTVELDAFDFAKTAASINMGAVAVGETTNISGNTSLRVDFSERTNANNGKRHAVAKVIFSSSVTAAQMQDNFSFDLIFRGTCTGDVWIWPDRTATVSFTKRFGGTDRGFGYTYVDGNSDKTITIPGTASKLITVASYKDKRSWTDINGTLHHQTATTGNDFTSLGATGGAVGDISPFSSIGPTADGRIKPDIGAPGEPIVSSMSANNTVATARKVNTGHFKNEGTSMSAPHVTGIIALIFQRNKCLTSNQVKKILTDNARADAATGTGASIPNNTWGYGRVNALAAMKDVTSFSGTCGTTGDSGAPTTPVTTTSGAASGSGCMNVAGRKTDPGLKIILFFVGLLALARLTLYARFITEK